jgi:hypothetical protein
MPVNRQPVNVLPPALPQNRLEELITRYRHWLHHPDPDSPPRWYVTAILAALESTLADRRVAA